MTATLVYAPGEAPCELSKDIARVAYTGVTATLVAMEREGQSRAAAVNMMLQVLLIEAGAWDGPAMERLARATVANVAAALRGDQSGATLDEMVAACEALDARRIAQMEACA